MFDPNYSLRLKLASLYKPYLPSKYKSLSLTEIAMAMHIDINKYNSALINLKTGKSDRQKHITAQWLMKPIKKENRRFKQMKCV